MKKKLVLSLIGCGLSLSCLMNEARGQAIYGPQTGGNYVRPPVVSPYLDLIRSRNTPAINYYLGTRSEIDRRASDAQLRQLEDDFNRRSNAPGVAPDDLEIPSLPSTGHGTAFMNTSHYFGGAQTAQSRPAMRPPQQARPQQGQGRPATSGRVR